MKKTIAVLEGDGIGPEIVREGIKVLKAIELKYDHHFELIFASFGAGLSLWKGILSPIKQKKYAIRLML